MIRAENLTKRFGNVTALHNVSFEAPASQVTCLLGDNGAGKSTLIRILSGVYAPDSGSCWIDGEAVRLDSPRAAAARGIATVHQDLGLIPLLSVWRNFFLGAEPARPFAPLDVAACRRAAGARIRELGVELADVDQAVGMLSGGQRQAIAIARAIHFGARLLILDEPTAALGMKQAQLVLDQLAHARSRGLAVILITHNPQHAYAIGDRFVLLKRGQVDLACVRESTDADQLARRLTEA